MIRKVFPFLVFGLLLYLLAFQVGNTDFFWHIKAGQLLRESGWITADPFAYTRIDQPYLATHPWLAQVILSVFWDGGGWVGITLLRVVLIAFAFGLPLLIDHKRAWFFSALSLLAALGARPAISDRPHLFTIVMFSVVATLCVLYLDEHAKRRKHILIILPLFIVLWSNLHGAASITGLALCGALFVQRLWNKPSEWKALLLAAVALCIAPLLTPNGISNISYLLDLTSDQSASLISEWQPSTWNHYFIQTGALWIAAITSIVISRKNRIFCVLVLVGIGYLSRTAARHEVLFLISALAITIHQLRSTELRIPIFVPVASVVILAFFTYVQAHRFTIQQDSFGFGIQEPMRGAAEFIQREEIAGNMFNNYNAGGELLFRGHKVFLDGRNIDYGYDYINRAVNAGVDPSIWNDLESEYDFTHAVIYYSLQGRLDPMPYVSLLEADPEWSLTYLDDFAAVYQKGQFSSSFSQITPRMLYRTEMPSEITKGNLQVLVEEVESLHGKKAEKYLEELRWAFEL